MPKYNPQKTEKKWQRFWAQNKTNSPNLSRAKKPFYNLMMFPYPSAEGLHVGNMYAFVHSDAYGRFMRLRGFDVFEPVGLDGFGIHSENYAIKAGQHILDVSRRTEKHFYEQMHMIGNQYDWTHHLETYKPDYYKWTQWLFVQMFKNGLAYQAESYVNWCPSCKTVLSDEQVISGKCERCHTLVEKKMMRQWFFKITDYAERLLKNLDSLSDGALGPNVEITDEMKKTGINWSERTKTAQKNWIGKSEGAQFRVAVIASDDSFVIPTPHFAGEESPARFAGATARRANADNEAPQNAGRSFAPLGGAQDDNYLKVFTTRLDTVFGMTYIVLAPEHPLIKNQESRIKNYEEVEKYVVQAKKKSEMERTELAKDKTGVELKGIKAVNPFNDEKIPVFVADYVLGHYGTGAVMAVPAHDERDWEFTKQYNLPIKMVICPNYPEPKCPVLDKAYVDDGHLVDSAEFTGLTSKEAREKLAVWLEKNDLGGRKVNYKLRDWCISRQRYWGPPIPMIYCPACAQASAGEENAGWQPVPEKDLPVLLPKTKDYLPRPDGLAPLARNEKFWKIKCPKCGGEARRETDVSDTFLDSAWYFLRYPSVGLKNKIFDEKITRRWLPVDMYIGGHEHAVLHLLYSRFMTMFLKDMGLIDFEEPYKRFFAHGLLGREGAKMSKSKGNVINPDEYIKKYGADAVRMYLMFMGDVNQGGDWRDSGMQGMYRFVIRVWKLSNIVIPSPTRNLSLTPPKHSEDERMRDTNSKTQETSYKRISNPKIQTLVHKTIKKITSDLDNLKFNTAISALMILVNAFEKEAEIPLTLYSQFLILLSPFAPHIAEELWSRTGRPSTKLGAGKKSIFTEKWPEYNAKLVKDETIQLIVQINGKVRDKIEVAAEISESDAGKTALESERVKKFLEGKEPKKVIFVRGKLVNIVA